MNCDSPAMPTITHTCSGHAPWGRSGGIGAAGRRALIVCALVLIASLPVIAQQDDDPTGDETVSAKGGDSDPVVRLLQQAAAIRHLDPKQALKLGEEAEQMARASGDSYGWSNALYSKCISSIIQGDVSTALKYAIQAATIKEKLSDQTGLAAIYSTMGTLYSKSGDAERALDYQTRALKHYELKNDRQGLSTVKNNLGLLYMNSGAYENALRFFNESIALKEQLNDKKGLANSYINVGIIHKNLGATAKAAEYFQNALHLFTQLHDNFGLAFANSRLASLAMARKRYTDVLEYAQIALPLARKANAREIVRDLYLLMSDAFTGLHDTTKAFEQYRLYTALKDSLSGSSNARVIANMAADYDIGRQKREVELLTKLRKEEQTREQAEARNRDAQIHLLKQDKEIAALQVEEKERALREQEYIAAGREKALELERREKDMFRDRAKMEALAKEKREQFLMFAIIGILLLGLVLVLLFRGYRHRRKSAERYRVKNEELEQANDEILRHEQVVEAQSKVIEHANHELHIRNKELEFLNLEKNEFLGIAAHDLKNPLIMIRSLAEMMNEPSTASRISVVEYADYIYKGADHMIGLVSNLLDVNAIESGGFLFQCTDTNLVPIAEKVLAAYRHRAEAKRLTLRFECGSQLLLAYADESAAEQILDNLVSNAIKYSLPERDIHVRLKSFYSVARLEVEDEGPGIRTEDLPKLFQKFVRLEAQPTGNEYSTGLGLSIVKKLAEAMNGNVWCESEYGKGSIFCVELPLAHPQNPPGEEAAQDPAQSNGAEEMPREPHLA
jgi:signal transduction histidine kinase